MTVTTDQRAPKRITVDEMTREQRREWIAQLLKQPSFARIIDKLLRDPDERQAA